MSAVELSSPLLNRVHQPEAEGSLQGRKVEDQTKNPSSFALKAHRFGLYLLSFLCAAGGVALIACAATGLIPWPIAIVSINLFMFSAILFMKAYDIVDYNNPKEVLKATEKAKNQSMERLLQLHGKDNLRKYGIVPESRFEEHEKLKQTLREESTFQGQKRDRIYNAHLGSKDRLLDQLRSLESSVHSRAYYQYSQIVDDVYAEAGITRHEKGSGFALPYWAQQKLSEKLKDRSPFGDKELNEIRALRDRVKKDPQAAELQRSYKKQVREHEKETDQRRKKVEAGETLERTLQPEPVTEPTELQKQVEELEKRYRYR